MRASGRLLALLAMLGPAPLAAGGPPAPDPMPSDPVPSDPIPATVVVAFDRERAVPLIVEGLADRASGRAVRANDPVRIASISKLVMGLAVMRLVDEGVVELGADVSDYLGWRLRAPGFPEAKVTLGQLLSHRSGLRDSAGYIIPLGESLRERLAQSDAWYPDAPPGEAPFAYANIGSAVVASAIEAASGERYDRLLERTVFAPLGITACTNWIGCGRETVARAVVLYRASGEVARDDPADVPLFCSIPVSEGLACSLEDYVPGTNASVFSPQGGVRIGMRDLSRIGQAMLRAEAGAPLSRASWERFLSSAARRVPGETFFCTYGLAVRTTGIPGLPCEDALFGDGLPRIGHGGEAYGLRSGLWVNREAGTGLAFFTTAVPPRASVEEGEIAPREQALVARALAMLGPGGALPRESADDSAGDAPNGSRR